jgi:hypothetical protein
MAGPWKGRKIKSGSNKKVAILQNHKRKRDLFESLAGNFPIEEPEAGAVGGEGESGAAASSVDWVAGWLEVRPQVRDSVKVFCWRT